MILGIGWYLSDLYEMGSQDVDQENDDEYDGLDREDFGLGHFFVLVIYNMYVICQIINHRFGQAGVKKNGKMMGIGNFLAGVRDFWGEVYRYEGGVFNEAQGGRD